MKPILVIDAGSRNTAILLALPNQKVKEWPSAVFPAENPIQNAHMFLKEGSLPFPATTLICSMGSHATGSAASSRRMQRWKDELQRSQRYPERMLQEHLPRCELESLLEETAQTFGPALAADSAVADVLAALGIPALQERCWQEGVAIIHAGHEHVHVFLVYRERLWGLYEHHADIPLPLFRDHLHALRLNWLPDEEVQGSGGHGCICGDLPAEAEGFHPTYIFGPESGHFAEFGRIIHPCADARFARCFGLLEALKRKEAA